MKRVKHWLLLNVLPGNWQPNVQASKKPNHALRKALKKHKSVWLRPKIDSTKCRIWTQSASVIRL
ncbi:hypothetical protein D9M69_593970 [compost metagenome]